MVSAGAKLPQSGCSQPTTHTSAGNRPASCGHSLNGLTGSRLGPAPGAYYRQFLLHRAYGEQRRSHRPHHVPHHRRTTPSRSGGNGANGRHLCPRREAHPFHRMRARATACEPLPTTPTPAHNRLVQGSNPGGRGAIVAVLRSDRASLPARRYDSRSCAALPGKGAGRGEHPDASMGGSLPAVCSRVKGGHHPAVPPLPRGSPLTFSTPRMKE